MSTEVRTQSGQVLPSGRDEVPAAAGGQTAPMPSFPRESPQAFVQESIKYRRRAQDAERRVETLESEIQNLRQAERERTASLESEVTQARVEAEALRGRLETAERDRQLEREFVRAGCVDSEAGLALARERLAGGQPPADVGVFVKGLLEEKPYLRGPAAARQSTGSPALPPRTAGVKPAGENAPRHAAQRLADRARETGSPGDIMAYVRARRGAGV